MKMQYFLAIIECDTEQLNEKTGPVLVRHMADLKTLVDKYGSCNYYQVTDITALIRFKSELKRLNPEIKL